MTGVARRASAGVLLAAMIVAGCAPRPDETYNQLLDAEQEIQQLQEANERLRTDLARREAQVSTLQALGEKRLEKLFHVDRIELGRYTGGINLDDREGDDAVKVFLLPKDKHGTVIKAAGEVTVELYDLAAEAEHNLVSKHHWSVDETAEHWSSGFLTYHYSFDCRWKPGALQHDEVTVRAVFTDYLTGRTFSAQKLCKVRAAPPATQPGE